MTSPSDTKAQITFLQSADPGDYARLLSLSSQTVQAYCAIHGCFCEQSLGIRYGSKPWHAALNRITILKDYVDRGYAGWIIYLDADAFIVDLSFDVRSFLQEHREAALIAAPSGIKPARWWDINNGVFALNCSHPLARQVVENWYALLYAIPEEKLNGEERWGTVADDQQMMHDALQRVPGLEQAFVVDTSVLNWNNRFIRQIIRAAGTFEQRVQRLSKAVENTLGDWGTEWRVAPRRADALDARQQANEEFTIAIYKTLLGREPDPGALKFCVSALNTGRSNFLNEMRNCLSCGEFGDNIAKFIDRSVSAETKERLRAALSAGQ